MNNIFSIWILPPLEKATPFKKIITSLSKKYNSPDFAPHITLLGAFPGKENFVVSNFEKLVSNLRTFDVGFDGLSFSTTYFQSVFLRVKPTASLLNANLEAKKIFNMPNDVFMPHMSLIYGNHSMEEREKISKDLEIPKNTSFHARKLVLVPTTDNPKDWKPISELTLKD